MSILYALLISFLVIFLEGFFVALGNVRIFYLLALTLFNKINWKYLLIFSVVTSVILDVVYHYVLGTNLLLLSISLFLLLIVSLLIPRGYNLPGYIVKFASIFLYYISVALIPDLISTGQLGSITWPMIGGMLIKSIISIIFCLVFDMVWGRLRKKEEGTKLRLK